MTDNPESQPVDPAMVKYLRLLVTILSATMIIGFIVITVLFVIRFSNIGTTELPETITLPNGSEAAAFTQGDGWYAVVTKDNQILIYNRVSGQLQQTIQIEAGQ
ncbi:DUF6476 family protein [Roseovarius sp. EL26]|uniref:DUF6476 family protein n=1 Tax=Roseovarius sp. EL26 TaxID=2126672 RepID=UPI000EA159F7|nr:DUF6476 family protein [Roseovarius sp. EL26]